MNTKISEMNYDEKPREKLISKGPKYLSNAELLAILIRTGDKKNNAISLSSQILKKSLNGIRGLEDLSIDELCKIKGVGTSKASIIKAALELGSRISRYVPENYKISNPWDVYIFYMEEMRYLKKEIFKVVLLNTKNEIICDVDVSVGSLNSSIVHPREVFVEAIKRSANSIILMHNHPSGNPEPSKEDFGVTKRLKECGEMIGIVVLDHIIIGEGVYYSMKEEGSF